MPGTEACNKFMQPHTCCSIDTTRIVCDRVYVTVRRLSVRPSVLFIDHCSGVARI